MAAKKRAGQSAASRGSAVRSQAARPSKLQRPSGARSGRESSATRRERAARILAALDRLYPETECALRHKSAYELLAATILSAQCTDERVNKVTPALFARYPAVESLARAEPAELEEIIRSTGFFRNKARSLIGMARRVVEQFGGEVPATMDELLTLPGVARKTANCVLGTWFRQNVGIVVDTHVGRLAQRLGLLTVARDGKDAVKIEQDLMPLFPQVCWTRLSHALIDHGRGVCAARTPRCSGCELAGECPSANRDLGELAAGRRPAKPSPSRTEQ